MVWFTRLRDWTTDESNGIGITALNHDSEDDNFAVGINASINVAGQNSPTANIPFGGFKITGAADGTAATDYATVKQVQTRTVAYAADSVGTDAYAITLTPALTAYAVGQVFNFAPGTANTGAATLAINGLVAKTIKKDKNVDLSDGDLVTNQIVSVVYDGTNFQMLSPPMGLINQSGGAIYAADGGGSDSYAITLSPAPAAYATGMVINFKANTGNTGAASLNVNSLGAKTIKKDQATDLVDNDIKASQIIQVIYDGTNFQMLSPIYGTVGQNGASIYAADAGSTDDYVITLAPVPTSYVTGMVIRAKCNTANTGAATINVNSLGAKSIVKGAATALSTGDILAGQIVTLIYDGTNFQIQSRTSNPTVVTPTAYAVVCGGTTSAGDLQTVVSVGTAGQALVSNGAGALPTFQASGQLILIQTNTSSSSAISEFNALFTSAYDSYLFEFLDVLPASDGVDFACLVGTGVTPTYIAANYKWAVFGGEGDTGFMNTASTSAALAYLTSNGRAAQLVDSSATFGGISGFLKVFGCDTTSRVTKGVGEIIYVGNDASTPINAYPTFFQPAATITAIKFYFSAGNIASGKIRMYGINNT